MKVLVGTFNQEKASVIVKSSRTFVWSSSTIASIYLFVPLLPPYSGIIYIKALARQAQVNLSSDIIQIWFIYLFYLMSSILWADRQEPCRAAIYSDDTQPHNNIKEKVCWCWCSCEWLLIFTLLFALLFFLCMVCILYKMDVWHTNIIRNSYCIHIQDNKSSIVIATFS